MSLKRTNDIAGGGNFFKPAEYQDALVLLVEPKSLQRDVPNTYKGVTKTRDEVTADVTVFVTQASLDNGEPDFNLKGVTLTHAGITNRMSRAIGEAVVGVIGQKQFENSPAPAWVLDSDKVTDDLFNKVSDYYDKREAAVKAALESAPSWD